MTVEGNRRQRARKALILLAKIAFAVGSLAVVFFQIDVDVLKGYLAQVDLGYLFLAFLIINGAQMMSSIRQRYYFQSTGYKVSYGFSFALYYVGMLLNHLLPGGVSGDGYKVYYMHKHYHMPWKQGVRQMISNRANGLLLLFLITYTLAFFSGRVMQIPYASLLIVGTTILTVVVYSVVSVKLLHEPVKIQVGAAKFSLLVQLGVMLTAMAILEGLHESTTATDLAVVDYMILFMLSCIVSVLPISVGGVGLRELTFFYGAPIFGLTAELGVLVAMLYYLVNFAASLIGLVWFFKMKPPSLSEEQNVEEKTTWSR